MGNHCKTKVNRGKSIENELQNHRKYIGNLVNSMEIIQKSMKTCRKTNEKRIENQFKLNGKINKNHRKIKEQSIKNH